MSAKTSGKQGKFDFSPYAYHGRLMDQATQAMAYDGGDVRRWQGRLRRKVRRLLGMDRVARDRPDLNVRSLWKRDHRFGTIEKIVFTSEIGADVPAYVCLPGGKARPHTFFICLQGHSSGMHNSIEVQREDETKPLDVPGGRGFGIGCMERGLAALCIEQRAFGEREENVLAGRSANRCHDAAMHAIFLGRTLIGERVHDVDRGIDYLAQRGDVDMKRIGVMGNSGGGTGSLFAAAMLGRIAYAMPSCYFCTFRESILSVAHCVCNYVPDLYNYAEMWDVMGLFAPRPVVIVAGREDTIFPLKGVRKAFTGLKRIYAAAGAPDQCQLVVGPEGHRFYPEQGWRKMLRLMG